VTRAEGDPSGPDHGDGKAGRTGRVIVDDVHIEADQAGVALDVETCEVDVDGSPELRGGY